MVSVPKTMKAWRVEGLRGVDSLVLHGEVPVPEPGENEVLVKFHAASLNFRDVAITNGKLSLLSTSLLSSFQHISTLCIPSYFH